MTAPHRRMRGAAARARQPIVPGWGQHPDLPDSLRILLLDHQYTQAAVGRMFGVTPQRVSQWCKRIGIPALKPRHRKRRWSWAESRFVPVRKYTFNQSTR